MKEDKHQSICCILSFASLLHNTATSPFRAKNELLLSLASILKDFRSAAALSKLSNLLLHCRHMCVGSLSLQAIVTSNRSLILVGHFLLVAKGVNNAVELVAATLARHNLHACTTLVAAIEYTED